MVPPALPEWWTYHAAQEWLETVTLREQAIDVAGESFVALTDPDNRSFAGVGADKVWPVSKRLTKFIAEHLADLLPAAGVDALVVEIGAGACPLPGMWLARRRQGTRVILTDLPYLLPLTAQNVIRNFSESPSSASTRPPEVAALRWGCAADLHQPGDAVPRAADLAIAADVVYLSEDVPNLFETIVALEAQVTLIAVQHPSRCCTADDFIEAAAGHGLTCESAGRGYSDDRVSIFMMRRIRAERDKAATSVEAICVND